MFAKFSFHFLAMRDHDISGTLHLEYTWFEAQSMEAGIVYAKFNSSTKRLFRDLYHLQRDRAYALAINRIMHACPKKRFWRLATDNTKKILREN